MTKIIPPHAISTKNLVDKINKLKLEKIISQRVINLNDYRNLKRPEKTKTILIVDDDQTIRLALKKIFEKEGLQVLLASEGSELTNHLEQELFHLVLLDINLPWVDGYDLCKLIKEHDDFKNIPIVFISGNNSKQDIQKGFEVGCNDYITKPFDVKSLIFKIRELIYY